MACKKSRNEKYAGGFPLGMESFEKLTDPLKANHGTLHAEAAALFADGMNLLTSVNDYATLGTL